MYSLNMLFQASPCHVFLHPTLIDIAFRKVAQSDFSSKRQTVGVRLVLEGKQASYLFSIFYANNTLAGSQVE